MRNNIDIEVIVRNIFRRKTMVITQTHRFPLGIVYHFIVKRKIRYRDEQNAVFGQIASKFF